jgi:Complex I intermediate-associated protein 30 (CIA30)
MGGISTGQVSREVQYHGRDANVLRGHVRLDNNGGFIQMATNFAPATTATADGTTSQQYNSFRTATPIDASNFEGIELDVLCEVPDSFNVQYVSLPSVNYKLYDSYLCLTELFFLLLYYDISSRH